MRNSKSIKVFYLMLVICCIQLSYLASGATSIVFSPSDDTMIRNDNPNSPFGLYTYMYVRNAYGTDVKKDYEIDSLINFNLFSIPPTATILSASIYIYYYNWSGTNPAGRNLNLHLITSSWSEQYASWRTQPTFRTTPSNRSTVPNSRGQWMTWNITKDVQYLIKERAYYGWVITDESNWANPNISTVYFRTKEYGSYIPYLEVTYTVFEANIEPIPGFSITPVNPTTKDTIQFTDNSYDPDGAITKWLWDFGDGNSSTSRNPTHTYVQNGQYTVTLQVTDNNKATNSASEFLSISKSSTPGFEFIIVACAIAFVFVLTLKGKKRN